MGAAALQGPLEELTPKAVQTNTGTLLRPDGGLPKPSPWNRKFPRARGPRFRPYLVRSIFGPTRDRESGIYLRFFSGVSAPELFDVWGVNIDTTYKIVQAELSEDSCVCGSWSMCALDWEPQEVKRDADIPGWKCRR